MFLLSCCGVQRPDYKPVFDRFASLQLAEPPPPPDVPANPTEDEAEIQFRAAVVFYRQHRWQYAIPAFAEAVDYDDDRHDARFYWAASLVLANRNDEALPLLEELLETPFEMAARPLLARVLFRQGRRAEARAAARLAAQENFDAAGWVARFDLLTE